MVKKILFLYLFVLIVSVGYCQENRWIFVTEDDEGYLYYLDMRTIIFEHSTAKIWIKAEKSYNDSIKYELMKWQFNYSNREMCEIETNIYYNSGKYFTRKLNECYEVIPESIGEIFYNYVYNIKNRK